MKVSRKNLLESMILGIAGLIAFTIISLIVFIIGLVFNFNSLRSGFVSEVNLILTFPLFFILVAVIKILIGGELIDWITRFVSKILGIKVLVDKEKPKNKLFKTIKNLIKT